MATLRPNIRQGVLVTRPVKAMPVLARPVLGRSTICKSMSAYAEELLPEVQALPLTFPVSIYDNDREVQNGEARPLSENKWKLKIACDAWSFPRFQKTHALMLAIAMQETTHMDVRERDASKDQNLKARNATIFNLSADLIEKTGYFGGGNFQVLTDDQWRLLTTKFDTERDEEVVAAVGILQRAFERFDTFGSIENTLAFVRAGGSGFDPNQTTNWRSFVTSRDDPDSVKLLGHIEEYMSCIKTQLLYIDQDHNLFWDARRPDIPCPPI